MPKSRLPRKYLATLRRLQKERQITNARIASIMGWRSEGAARFKLSGGRGMTPEELQKLCKDVFGMTLIDLAAAAEDFVVTWTPEAVYGARGIDSLPLAQRQDVLDYIDKVKARIHPST